MLPDRAYDLIREFEGYLRRLNDGTDRVRPYLCPAHVPTIGWGSTRYWALTGNVARPTGRVTMADEPITQARAEECFRGELTQNEQAFDRLTTKRVHPLMRGAICSFIYNCGEGAYRASSLRAVINSGQWDKVPRELAKWRVGGGQILAGLVRRRRQEAVLFMDGVSKIQSGDVGVPSTPTPAPAPAPAPAPVPMPSAPKGWWRSIAEWVLK